MSKHLLGKELKHWIAAVQYLMPLLEEEIRAERRNARDGNDDAEERADEMEAVWELIQALRVRCGV